MSLFARSWFQWLLLTDGGQCCWLQSEEALHRNRHLGQVHPEKEKGTRQNKEGPQLPKLMHKTDKASNRETKAAFTRTLDIAQRIASSHFPELPFHTWHTSKDHLYQTCSHLLGIVPIGLDEEWCLGRSCQRQDMMQEWCCRDRSVLLTAHMFTMHICNVSERMESNIQASREEP